MFKISTFKQSQRICIDPYRASFPENIQYSHSNISPFWLETAVLLTPKLSDGRNEVIPADIER